MPTYDRFSEKELQILQARAARVAGSAVQGEQPGSVIPALRITVRSETYAMPLDSIAAVYDETPIIPVPCAPPFIAGIANIRGHIIPVLDLAALLGIPGEASPEMAVLVVADNGEFSAAFCIEQIGEVAALTIGSLTPIPGNVELAQAAYLQGTTPDGTVLLDVDAILNDPQLTVDQAAA